MDHIHQSQCKPLAPHDALLKLTAQTFPVEYLLGNSIIDLQMLQININALLISWDIQDCLALWQNEIKKPKSKNENRKSKNENRKTKGKNQKSTNKFLDKIEKRKSKVENRKTKIENRKTKIEIFFRVAEPVKIQFFL